MRSGLDLLDLTDTHSIRRQVWFLDVRTYQNVWLARRAHVSYRCVVVIGEVVTGDGVKKRNIKKEMKPIYMRTTAAH